MNYHTNRQYQKKNNPNSEELQPVITQFKQLGIVLTCKQGVDVFNIMNQVVRFKRMKSNLIAVLYHLQMMIEIFLVVLKA
jgi:hypothetical protein